MNSRDPFINDYAQWLRENGHDDELRKKHNPPIYKLLLAVLCLFWKYTAIIGVIVIVRFILQRKKAKARILAEWKKVYAMKSILCAPIMVNAEFVEGNKDIAPGLFIGSFEDVWSREIGIRQAVYANIQSARSGGFGDEVKASIQAVYDNEEYVMDRRRPVPKPLCEGLRVYFFDVALAKEWMNPTAWTDGEWAVICAAEPGSAGEIHLIPDEAINRKLRRVMEKTSGSSHDGIGN